MDFFAVIDTETNWENQVMSIGTVIADCGTFRPVDAAYHVLTPEYQVGGMYEGVLFPGAGLPPRLCTRGEAMEELLGWLGRYGVADMFAYNAAFDRNHLPELAGLCWYDIIRIAAYRQHNPKIPPTADCCATGRLRRSYGVQPMLRLLSGNRTYCETHNALLDAMGELEIMRLLARQPQSYIRL
ncbi:MAG: hypothetical protein Q4F17_08120 [Eubacteriales bacterium]|nr:hypothetical protein [Eubacteriales bacterium]